MVHNIEIKIKLSQTNTLYFMCEKPNIVWNPIILSDKGVVILSLCRYSEVHWRLCAFPDTDLKYKMLIVISEQSSSFNF